MNNHVATVSYDNAIAAGGRFLALLRGNHAYAREYEELDMAMRKTSAARVKEILLDHVRNAATALRGTPPSDESIHEARKQIKRARTSLRLLRDAIGRKAYRDENVALRNAARPLSRVRDAQVMREALENLCGNASMTSNSSDPIRRSLVREYDSARRAIAGPALGTIRKALEGAERRIKALPAPDSNGALLAAAAERLYRKGGAALAQATVDRTETKLHEARKQTKYLGLALESLHKLLPLKKAAENYVPEAFGQIACENPNAALAKEAANKKVRARPVKQ